MSSVRAYLPTTATLILNHDFPPGSEANAFVQLDLVLENISSEHIRVGEWVNVVGYLTAHVLRKETRSDSHDVHVQALLLWPTGPLDIQRYERSLIS